MTTILSVSNPIYSNSTNTSIDVTLDTVEHGVIPFTATANDPMDYGQQLWSDINSGKYGDIAAYVAPTLSASQKASNAISGGIILTSTGTPALNGTYSVAPNIQGQINAVVTYILLNSNFPGGASELPWPDASGTMHVFPTTTSFTNFASAVANFVAQASIYGSSNGAIGSIPSNQITIP